MQYANFALARIQNLMIKESDFSCARFMENKIKNIEMDHVKFYHTEFIKVNLSKVDFSTCDITGVEFDLNSLKGIIIDPFQSSSLIGMLGVKIKSDE